MIYYNKEENIVYYKVDEGINASFYEVQDNVGVKIITLNNGIYNVYNHYLILRDNKRGDKVYDLKTKQTLLKLPIGYSISFYNDWFCFASSGDVYHKIYYNSDLEEILKINLGE